MSETGKRCRIRVDEGQFQEAKWVALGTAFSRGKLVLTSERAKAYVCSPYSAAGIRAWLAKNQPRLSITIEEAE